MLIDWFTVAAQAINFLILVWLLKRFLYKPVLAAIDEREKRIAAQLQDAEKQKTNAWKEQAEFRHKNEEFEQQRSALLLEATNAAKIERDKLFEAARKDSEELRLKLQKGVQGEFDNLNRKIGNLARQEVFSITRKTLADLAGVSLEERLTDVFIHRLHDMNDMQKEGLRTALQVASNPAIVRSAFDLTPGQKAAVENAVKPLFRDGTEIHFETKSELISGIELTANGQKIAWNIADYLASLTNSLSTLMEPKLQSAPASKETVPHAA
jgi:F-type H+-transporting ATPase subunit b